MQRSAQRGLTLIEISTAAAIATATLATAIGGFGGLLQGRHTEGVAAELATDLQLARTESVMRNVGVRVSFQGDAGGSRCYVVHTGGADACSCLLDGPPVCSGDTVALKSVRFPSDGRTVVQANVGSMLFDPTRATVTPTATIQVRAADGRQINHVVNLLGRVRSCAAAGQWSGLRAC